MKELNIFIFAHELSTVTEILRRHNIAGMSFTDIHATGHTKRKEVPEMVRMYQTGRMGTPEHEKRTKVETLVPDSEADSIVQELVKSIGSESEPGGLVFVTAVSNAHLLGTSRSGESLLIKE
ncbi:MAG: P-II family nitrogen regulator [Nitrososphaeraceae archaeon]